MAFKILLHFAAGISKDIHDVGGSKSGNRPPQVFVESATPGVSTQVQRERSAKIKLKIKKSCFEN